MFRKWCSLSVTQLVLSVFLLTGSALSPDQTLAADDKFTAFAKCQSTGKTGQVTKSTRKDARAASVQQCIANGGIKGCCKVQWVRKVQD